MTAFSYAGKAGKKGHLGIIGGGQLGCMLHQAAQQLNIPVRISDPSPEAPGRLLDDGVAASTWAEVAQVVADGAQVVTWEREDLNPDEVTGHGAPVVPSAMTLGALGDRKGHKLALQACGIDTARWALADTNDVQTLARIECDVGFPAMVKARRGGFDGRGQALVRTTDELSAALERFASCGAVVEELVDFHDEFAVLLTRGADGQVVHYPVVWTHQCDGQLAWAAAPHPLSDSLTEWAQPMIAKLAQHLEFVGTLAVECFRCADRLVVNEIAPRVHNSGHWTIEGCSASQFENHVRAVYGLPLEPVDPLGVSLMANCIGAMPEQAAAPGVHWHDYHKQPRDRRKVGHVTVVAADYDQLLERMHSLPAHIRPGLELLPWRSAAE